jgi:hypothetical protein
MLQIESYVMIVIYDCKTLIVQATEVDSFKGDENNGRDGEIRLQGRLTEGEGSVQLTSSLG